MEKRGSGLRKIYNETAKLPGFSENKKPTFRSEYESFFTEILNNNYEHEEKTNIPQNVPQNNGYSLDLWIEEQIKNNPKITTEELAKLCNKTSKTIKRHISQLPHIVYVGRGSNGHWEITLSKKM